MKPKLTQKVLKDLLHYDPDTGIFTWKFRHVDYFSSEGSYKSWNTKYANKIAGSKLYSDKNKTIYLKIGIFGKPYLAHRLSYLYIEGEFPSDEIDHNNGNGLNNKWYNLQKITHQNNQRNRSVNINNKTGIMGIRKHRNKFESSITVNSKYIYLGVFVNFFEACCTRKSAEVKHGFHINHGRV